jgi:hypothetical protein
MIYFWMVLSGYWIAVLTRVTGYENAVIKPTTLDTDFRQDDDVQVHGVKNVIPAQAGIQCLA